MKIITISIILVMLTSYCTVPKNVIWISSNPEVQWQEKIVTIKSGTNHQPDSSSIIIAPYKFQQRIDGFGGCFNELGWEALTVLSEEDRTKVFASLFDTVAGCRFELCRMPLGANDYSVGWYSHDETADDFDMSEFSIDRDKQRLIPYIREAKTYNSDIKVWASPWCPPSWMKNNNHYACRPDAVNDLKEEGRGAEMQTQFRMEPEYLRAYSLYFSRFIQAYQKEGIEIYAVHVQNEPNSCQNFPSCIWEPSDLAHFIGGYLGPEFEADGLDTEIWLGTIERPHPERVDTILKDPLAQKYIKGVGFQWAGKGAIPYVHEHYPDQQLMQTETECGNGSNDWKAAEHTFDLMKHYFNNGANSYMYWNMILDETGKSQWGWKQNSMITVDTKTRDFQYNPEFYLMKHFSHFISSGFHKVESSDKNCLAFQKESELVIVYYNSGKPENKAFIINDMVFDVLLDGQSFNTFIIKL